MKMTVSRRLILGFGLLSVCLIGLGLFSLKTMSSVNVKTEEIINNWMPSVSKSHQMKMLATNIRQLQGDFINNPSDTSIEEKMSTAKSELKAKVEAYMAESVSVEGKKAASKFYMEYEAGEVTDQQIIDAVKSGNQSAGLYIFQGNSSRFYEGLQQNLDALIAINEKEASMAGQDNQRSYNSGYQIIVVAMMTIFLFSILLSLWTIRSILSPVRKINRVLKDLANAKGDLSQRIHINSGDEIQVMAENVNNVLETIERMVIQIRRSTEGVASSSIEIQEKCEQLTEATTEINAAVTHLSESAAVQASRMSVTEKHVGQYFDKLTVVAVNAQETYELALAANENSSKGNDQIVSILGQMRIIIEQNEKTNELFDKFQHSLHRIEEVNSFIKSLASQTSILSLNAGIEAARAGIEGRGFAVVAKEIRSLAEHTNEYVSNIVELVEQIKSETEFMTNQFTQNTNNILDGSAQMEQLMATLDAINKANSTVMNNGSKTKTEAEQMTRTALDIVDTFQQIGLIIGEQSASSQEVTASVEEQLSNTHVIASFAHTLSEQSEQLKELVELFNVHEDKNSLEQRNVIHDEIA